MVIPFACLVLAVCNPMPQRQHIARNGALLPLPVEVVTVYHAMAEQTDSTPLVTADGSYLTPEIIQEGRYCAVSQDLLWFTGGILRWGDAIWVDIDGDLAGQWFVHDTMAAGLTGYVDLLVPEDVLECWIAEGARVRHPGGCR